MERKISLDILKPDGFDILSAVWVFACNDENPIITYEGLRNRLNLDSTSDVKKLVQSRVDLFRPGVTISRLERWKTAMCEGRKLPRWISDIEDAPQQHETILAITPGDVFRSQFRTEEGAPKSSLAELDWGLAYIERLRKAHVEERETTAKSWQMYLVLCASVLNIIATVVVGIYKVAK